MTRRLQIALAVFTLLALLELGDIVGLVLTLRNPAPAAAQLGVSVAVQMVRAIVLLLLAVQIFIGAAVAAGALLRRRWLGFRAGALFGAVGCVVSGLFQIISGLAQVANFWLALLGAGYIALGWWCFWFARSPVANQPPVASNRPSASGNRQ